MKDLRESFSPLSRALKRRSKAYRNLHAFGYIVIDKLWGKTSYSQWKEDRVIMNFLQDHGGIDFSWIYIDVGANHPTVINDTFLFYRAGYSGILIEPNRELARLCRMIRKRDTVLNVGAGDRGGELLLYVTTNPVFSSFAKSELEDEVASSYVVPVIRLDDLRHLIGETRVFLLKIDTEGFDQKVLDGSRELLCSTMVVLTETRDEDERYQRANVLGSSWRVMYSGANTIFVNRAFFPNLQ